MNFHWNSQSIPYDIEDLTIGVAWYIEQESGFLYNDMQCIPKFHTKYIPQRTSNPNHLQSRLLFHQRIPGLFNFLIGIIPKQKFLHHRISPLIWMAWFRWILRQHNSIPLFLFRTIMHVKNISLLCRSKDDGASSGPT